VSVQVQREGGAGPGQFASVVDHYDVIDIGAAFSPTVVGRSQRGLVEMPPGRRIDGFMVEAEQTRRPVRWRSGQLGAEATVAA
jgi:hypothetical protein